jgi:hypothetical protein
MKSAIRAFDWAWVTHELLATHLRFEERAGIAQILIVKSIYRT